VLRALLRPASWLYGAAVETRLWLYRTRLLKQKRLKGAVISVGNLTMGGTGKTPMVIWLAEKLMQQGQRVAILSRGYRGTGGSSDEVELMRSRLQNRAMFGVGKDRFAQGHRVESRQAIDVFLLDDGFQHLQLARNVDIVLIDASRVIGKQALLPAGPMRERISSLTRADIVVYTRTQHAQGTKEAIQRFWKMPLFAASTVLLGFRQIGVESGPLNTIDEIGSGPFFAFCGIGNPESFKLDLEMWGIPLVGQMVFRDHHRYTVEDLRAIEVAAQNSGAKGLITTEKDSWNVPAYKFVNPLYASVIDLKIDGENALLSAIDHLIQARGAAA
jgi:tetraacyldisaccharide 4'-kinase